MTARKPRRPADPPADLGVIELGDDLPPTPQQMLAEFFGESHDAEVVCSIYEVGQDNSLGFLHKFPFSAAPSAHDIYEQILEKYGPGVYEFWGQARDTGKLVPGGRKRFRVGTERDRQRALFPDRAKPDEPARAAPTSSGDISPALAAILDNQNRMLERLLESQADRPRERDTLSMARELLELKNLFGSPPSAPTPVAEIFSIVKDVLKLKDELSDGGEDSNPLAVAMKQLAPVISRAVDKLNDSPATPARPARVAPAAGAHQASAAPAPPAPQPNGGSGVFSMNFDAVFLELAALAEQNTPPADASLAVLDWLAAQPGWIEQAVLGLVMDEQERVVGRIVGACPKLEGKREWLTQVVQALIAAVESAGDGDGEGDGDDAGGDGGSAGDGAPAHAGAA